MAAAKTQDLLLEIGCEDLPARYVLPLAEALSTGIADGLVQRGLACGLTRHFATPRRLAVLVTSVPGRQPGQTSERFGPATTVAYKDGKPTAAALGFAKSCGVGLDELDEKNGKLHFVAATPGRSLRELLPGIFDEALAKMDGLVPKRMRWGTGDETFVRPVQWITAMHGPGAVPIRRFGLTSGKRTFGHRFHAPKAISLKSPAEYEKRLMAARVWADFGSRREEIRRKVEAEARKLKGVTETHPALLEEVTALVEWPVVISGRIEPRYLSLPKEVIIATIEHNQRYFPVLTRTGQLLPRFIAVSNIQSRNKTDVVAGNERVVRPRLSDALFFWEQDLKTPLSALVESLDRVTFHQKLGSVGDKRRRIEAISTEIASTFKADLEALRRAAELCKADLVTRMVFEFPELQGIMGGYYAKSSGETDEVAAAIREHYQPLQAGGPIPATSTARIVALADKLDSLAGSFSIGQKPTASKDPFALRRAALGVLRILIEGELDLDLKELLAIAVRHQPAVSKAEALVEALLQFHWDRLRAFYLESGVAAEIFEAVVTTGHTRPCDLERRIRAVEQFRKLPEAEFLAAAHKRVRNILRQANERHERIDRNFDGARAEPAETQLLDAIHKLKEAQPGIFRRDGEVAVNERWPAIDRYLKALTALASLQGPVDRFFDQIMVMADDPAVRSNRLALLADLDGLFRAVADISCLPG